MNEEQQPTSQNLLDFLLSKVPSLGVFAESATNCKGYRKAMVSDGVHAFNHANRQINDRNLPVLSLGYTNHNNNIKRFKLFRI